MAAASEDAPDAEAATKEAAPEVAASEPEASADGETTSDTDNEADASA